MFSKLYVVGLRSRKTQVPLSVFALLSALLLLFAPSARAQVGHVLSGVGPVDQGWSGAGTANPQDVLGALHWNPASITGLQGSSVSLSLQLLFPTGDISSTVGQGAFGPFGPPVALSGSTPSNAGPFPIPALGYVYHRPGSPWAFGVSAFGVGGFGVDYEASAPPFDQQGNLVNPAANPILTPQFPRGGLGFGAIFSEFALLQVAPTVAYQINETVSIGIAPTVNYALLEVNPFPATAPVFVETPTPGGPVPLPLYPDAPREGALGFGFQAGVQVRGASGLNLGGSFKSTQWFGDFTFTSDEVPAKPPFTFRLDYPMILSFGVGYTGLDCWAFAADVRYIDFAHTEGFNDSGFDDAFAVKGFGWNSILVFAAGAQYHVTDRLPVRAGYSFNEQPIDDAVSFFNTPSPAIIQHRLSGGFSYALSETVTASLAAQYGFKNHIEGPGVIPLLGSGPAQGTLVRNELSTFFIIFGVALDL